MTNSPETRAELMALIQHLLDLQEEHALNLIFLGNPKKDAREYTKLSTQILELRAKLHEMSTKLKDKRVEEPQRGGSLAKDKKRPDRRRTKGL